MGPCAEVRALERCRVRNSIKQLGLAASAAMLAGCGVGCLYGESGKVTVIRTDSRLDPERVVAVVGDALRPLGFSGPAAEKPAPGSPRYWDYRFSVGAGKFAPRERVDVLIKFDGLSISLADFAGGWKASRFDRGVTEAIETRLRSELDADIAFTHAPTPAFCLGP